MKKKEMKATLFPRFKTIPLDTGLKLESKFSVPLTISLQDPGIYSLTSLIGDRSFAAAAGSRTFSIM